MADSSIIREWVQKADEDFLFASANLRDGKNFYGQICFHFNQSAEKYLKAYIIAYDLAFEKVHNLIHLLKICIKHNESLASLMDECIFLNPAYIDTRYPVHWPTDYSKDTALKSEKACHTIGKITKALLPASAT